MTEVKLTIGRLLKIWWAIQWRSAVVGLLFFAICLFAWRLTARLFWLSGWVAEPSIYVVTALLGALIGIPFGMIAVRWFLSARFSDFQLQLLDKERRDPPTFRIEPRIGNLGRQNFPTRHLRLHPASRSTTESALPSA